MKQTHGMGASRLEAFSDGVIAVIITIVVLEMKVPAGADFAALGEIVPFFLAYILSFTVIGIYWNNHHHLLRNIAYITPRIMWTNLVLLFWLSLLPFCTLWLSEHYEQVIPTVVYGAVLFLASVAYFFLLRAILAEHKTTSAWAKTLRTDIKGPLSTALFALAIGLAFVHPWIADVVYVAVAVMWFIPDRRLASGVSEQ